MTDIDPAPRDTNHSGYAEYSELKGQPTMTEQNLTPDADDTEGHFRAAVDEDTNDADDTEGHRLASKADNNTSDADDTDDTEGHRRF